MHVRRQLEQADLDLAARGHRLSAARSSAPRNADRSGSRSDHGDSGSTHQTVLPDPSGCTPHARDSVSDQPQAAAGRGVQAEPADPRRAAAAVPDLQPQHVVEQVDRDGEVGAGVQHRVGGQLGDHLRGRPLDVVAAPLRQGAGQEAAPRAHARGARRERHLRVRHGGHSRPSVRPVGRSPGLSRRGLRPARTSPTARPPPSTGARASSSRTARVGTERPQRGDEHRGRGPAGPVLDLERDGRAVGQRGGVDALGTVLGHQAGHALHQPGDVAAGAADQVAGARAPPRPPGLRRARRRGGDPAEGAGQAGQA